MPDRRPSLGTLLRHVHELMDGDIAALYVELGMPEYRPRFSPVVRALAADGPMAIRDLAGAICVTHSAASQTVGQMARLDLVTLKPGADSRQRIVHLTARARSVLALVEAEWAATEAAVRDLDSDLPMPLAELLTDVLRALERRPFGQRVRESGHLDRVGRST